MGMSGAEIAKEHAKYVMQIRGGCTAGPKGRRNIFL